jgi:hypothetical protein
MSQKARTILIFTSATFIFILLLVIIWVIYDYRINSLLRMIPRL